MANNVTYQSNAKEIKQALNKLEKKALRETAKFLRKEIKKQVPVDDGVLKKNVGSWVKGRINEVPKLEIGVYDRARSKKKGYTYAYHAHLVQFGTVNMPGIDFMRSPVLQNIGKIRDIQAEYIRQIENIQLNGLPVEDEQADD